MGTGEKGQSTPPLDIRRQREVEWFVTEQKEVRRCLWLGKKIVERHVRIDDFPYVLVRKISADDIGRLEDPDLKYALRLQDAVNASGLFEDGNGLAHGHFVQVHATDEGENSRLTNAVYTGIGDSLMNDLRSVGVRHEDNRT